MSGVWLLAPGLLLFLAVLAAGLVSVRYDRWREQTTRQIMAEDGSDSNSPDKPARKN